MLLILLILILMIFFIMYFLTRDLFSPGCILCESYLLSIISGYINSKLLGWNFTINSQTFLVCIVGILSFEIVFFLLYFVRLRAKQVKKTISKDNILIKSIDYIEISKWKVGMLIIFQVFTLLLYVFYFTRNIGNLNLVSIQNTMMAYRSSYYFSANGNSNMIAIPGFIFQMTKISRVVAYVSIYIFILNNLTGKRKKSDVGLLISCLIYIPIVLLSGGRYYIIMFFISAFMIWHILTGRLLNNPNFFKKFLKIVCIVIAILIFFSETRTLVGRNSTSGIVEYITGYFGKNIKMLDMYLKDSVSKSDIWGKETFYALNRLLYKIGIVKENYTIYLEFRTLNGISMGNTYTSFRCMLQDFGISGVIILQVIEGGIFAIFYQKIKRLKNKYSLLILLYSMMIGTLFMHSYSESFYNEVVSLNYIIFIISFYILGVFLRIQWSDRFIFKIRRKL